MYRDSRYDIRLVVDISPLRYLVQQCFLELIRSRGQFRSHGLDDLENVCSSLVPWFDGTQGRSLIHYVSIPICHAIDEPNFDRIHI